MKTNQTNVALLVTTQYMENYADADQRPCWKAKGGQDYLITGLPDSPTNYDQTLALEACRDKFEWHSDASWQYVIATRLVPADYDPAAGETDERYAKHLREGMERIEYIPE